MSANGRIHASAARPCPVCLGDHACSEGGDGLIFCRRRQGAVEGFSYFGQARGDPQWGLYRRADGAGNGEAVPGPGQQAPGGNGPAAPKVNWPARHENCRQALTPALLGELARALGLPAAALEVLEVGWWAPEGCWAFPESDAGGNVVGLLRRYRDGNKKAMGGGARGICTPSGWADRAGPVLLVEGPSDTAALWALGLRVLGRPSATGGVGHLATLLKGLPADTEVLVVGENDHRRDGTWPGMDGARHTAGELTRLLGRDVWWVLPPAGHKDARAWALAKGLIPARPDAWPAAGRELLADLQANAYSVPAPGPGTENESADPPLIACADLKAVADDAQWVVPGYLARGAVTLLSALWKAGKTTLLAHLLKALAGDGTFLGRDVKRCKVLFITEESQALWAERRDKLGLGDNVTFIVRPFRAKPDKGQWARFLGYLRRVQEQERFGLVVFDTLTSLWPVRDENSAPEVREALTPLHDVISDAALALIHHLRKSDGTEGTASRGSGDLMAFVDAIVELRRYDASDYGCTRRVLTGLSRWDATPAQLVIELTADGYVAVGDRAEAKAGDLDLDLAGVIPAEAPGLTVEEILDAWPRMPRVRRQDLLAALAKGCAAGRWVRTGEGKRGDPYLFHKPVGDDTSKQNQPPPRPPEDVTDPEDPPPTDPQDPSRDRPDILKLPHPHTPAGEVIDHRINEHYSEHPDTNLGCRGPDFDSVPVPTLGWEPGTEFSTPAIPPPEEQNIHSNSEHSEVEGTPSPTPDNPADDGWEEGEI
jgi:hypothetical protein